MFGNVHINVSLTAHLCAALQYIDHVMKNIKYQEERVSLLAKERERQADLLREHQMWQTKIEYMR